MEKEGGELQEHTVDKDRFKLFDFFAVCEYFEEKFNYDEIIDLPPIKGTGGAGGGGGGATSSEYTNVDPDPLKGYVEKPVPAYGMKIDRKFFEKFEDTVKAAPEVRERYEQGDIKGAEEVVIATIFNKPEDFFDLAKLRKALSLDRRLTLREVLAKAFGDIDGLQDQG